MADTQADEVFAFDSPKVDRSFGRVVRKPRKTIQERFEEFHVNNPVVYNLMVKYAFDMKAAGHTQYSCFHILLRVKWDTDLTGSIRGALCHDFSSRYARRIMDTQPDLVGFFTTAKLKAA